MIFKFLSSGIEQLNGSVAVTSPSLEYHSHDLPNIFQLNLFVADLKQNEYALQIKQR